MGKPGYGKVLDQPVVAPDSNPSAKNGIGGPTHVEAVSSQGPALVTVTQYHCQSWASTSMLEVVSPVLQT